MPGTIAIEFNESAIKIAEGRRKGNTLELIKLQIIPTPSGVIKDERLQGQNAADILKKYLTEQYFSASKSLFTRNVTAVVSPASAITRQLLLPLTADSSIASMVKYELKEFFPSSADDYIIRHKNLCEAPEAGGVKKMRIFAAALPKQIVEDYYYFCESLKLKPSVMSMNYETAQKVFEFCGTINGLELSKFNTVALLDIGFSYKYHRRHSLDGLIDYMRQIYKVETVRYQRDYSPNREQDWQNAVQLMEQEHLDNERKEHYKKVFCNIEQAVLILLMVICIVLLCWVKEKSTLLDKEPEIEVNTHTQYESQISKESYRLSGETELPSFGNNKLQYL